MTIPDPAKELKAALDAKYHGKKDADLKPSEKADRQKEKDAIAAERVKAWKAPKTKAARKKLRDEREAAWLGGDA